MTERNIHNEKGYGDLIVDCIFNDIDLSSLNVVPGYLKGIERGVAGQLRR